MEETQRVEPTFKTYAVLLAGGSGTRLWPVSRERYPKQLVNFIGKDSLVQSTLKRLRPVIDPEQVRIVCGQEHYHEITRHIEETGVSAQGKVIGEPCGRNTAPAVLLAAIQILRTETDAVILIFPADHVIGNVAAFHQKIHAAVRLAGQGYVVTFGIQPHYPETGYGYIEGAAPLAEGALRIKRFVEKPDKPTAEKYIAAGNFYWNSGMFAFRASVLREEYRRLAPDLDEKMDEMVNGEGNPSLARYQTLPDISFDYAIMEKTDKGAVLPSDFGWSDIGSWKSLYDFLPKDAQQNVTDGDVIAQDTHNCFILGRERLIATNRLRNMVVVDTPDSVFVSDLDTSRDVKQIVETLKASGREEFKTHRTVHCPWGTVTVLAHEADSKVDRVVIYPRRVIPCQPDEPCVKHVSVVGGEGTVSRGDKDRRLRCGTAFQIAGTEPIRITNTGDRPLVLIAVSVYDRH